ncbi:hypothetical protein BZA70DRAFT_158471 [Myxozyma melibiosi]|uniref:Factor arrest protein 11 n=1 Tax=Myxozyma melibiosi TaxID=54550 RepID=A0ABR1F8I3_9ASCO
MRLSVVSPIDTEHDADSAPVFADPLNANQIRRLSTKPRFRAPEFKYDYADSDSFTAELEEWFTYSDNDYLLDSYDHFLAEFPDSWTSTKPSKRENFVRAQLKKLQGSDVERTQALLVLYYIAIGVFANSTSQENQIELIRENAALLVKCDAVTPLYQCIRNSIDTIYESSPKPSLEDEEFYNLNIIRRDVFLALTILYIMIESVDSESFCDTLASQDPNLISYFIKKIATFRLSIPDDLPWRNIFLLTWKLILRIFGGSQEIAAAKAHARAQSGLPPESPIKEPISASPIDYQAFRQSISSRYPGYKPATAESLPREFAIYVNPSASSSSSSLASLASEFEFSADPLPGSSVHIATPAPSPPPSPPPQSSKSKKSVFQTDRSFPFLYPRAEGDSETETVPTSIQEAEEIFAQRLRTSLGIVQLWREREEFMKQERGWIDADPVPPFIPGQKASEAAAAAADFDERSQKRLDRVEIVYREILPVMQSFVVTTLKFFLSVISPLEASIVFSRPMPSFLNSGMQQQLDSNNGEVKSELENARETEIILKAISATLYLLLKWFRASHILKFEFLSQMLFDCNICPMIVQLFNAKEIEQFILQIPEVPELKFFAVCRTLASGGDLPDRLQLTMSRGENGDREGAGSSNGGGGSDLGAGGKPAGTEAEKTVEEVLMQDEVSVFSRRNLFSSINLLKVFQKIVKNKAYRHLSLLAIKVPNALRKTLRISQYDARLYALKIIKGQVPYCGRKWRHANMRVITAVYLYCRQDLRDNWLAGVDSGAAGSGGNGAGTGAGGGSGGGGGGGGAGSIGGGEVGGALSAEDSYPKEVALRALVQFYNMRRYPESIDALSYQEPEEDFFARELENIVLEEENGW